MASSSSSSSGHTLDLELIMEHIRKLTATRDFVIVAYNTFVRFAKSYKPSKPLKKKGIKIDVKITQKIARKKPKIKSFSVTYAGIAV
jgi:hypothetical protein